MNAEFTHADRQVGIRNTVIVLLLMITVLFGLFLNRVLTPRVLNAKEMVNNGAIMFETPREISEFSFTDQYGGAFSREQLKGQWTFVFFGFTHCPDICPTTLALFNQIAKNIQDEPISEDTRFMLVTVDPARDTPSELKRYIAHFNEDFIGVTGEFIGLKTFATQLNVAFRKVVTNHDTGDYTIDHGGNVALINPDGHYHGLYKPPLDASKMTLTYKSVRMQNR